MKTEQYILQCFRGLKWKKDVQIYCWDASYLTMAIVSSAYSKMICVTFYSSNSQLIDVPGHKIQICIYRERIKVVSKTTASPMKCMVKSFWSVDCWYSNTNWLPRSLVSNINIPVLTKPEVFKSKVWNELLSEEHRN